MKLLILGLVCTTTLNAMAYEYSNVPLSCYKAAKKAALVYADSKYIAPKAKTPFYAEKWNNKTIVPVFITSPDLDTPARVNVIVHPLKNGECKVEMPFGS